MYPLGNILELSVCSFTFLPSESFCLYICLLLSFPPRAWGSAEVCTPLPQLHLQGQGSPAGPLPAGPVPGHGGCHRSGGRALPGVHRVGQGWEEDLPQTGTRGETLVVWQGLFSLWSSSLLVSLGELEQAKWHQITAPGCLKSWVLDLFQTNGDVVHCCPLSSKPNRPGQDQDRLVWLLFGLSSNVTKQLSATWDDQLEKSPLFHQLCCSSVQLVSMLMAYWQWRTLLMLETNSTF